MLQDHSFCSLMFGFIRPSVERTTRKPTGNISVPPNDQINSDKKESFITTMKIKRPFLIEFSSCDKKR